MKKNVLLMILLAVLNSCSWFSPKKAEVGNQEKVNEDSPRIVQSIPSIPRFQREPGSLWSEDSKWNDIYSTPPSRIVGDTVNLKVTETLKTRIKMALREKNTQEQNEKDDKQALEDAEAAKKSGGTALKQKKEDTQMVEATIVEVLPRNTYKVGLNRAFKLGEKQPYVIVEGTLKEKEIQPDETVSSDSLMNLKVDAFEELKPEQLAQNQPVKKTSDNDQTAAQVAAKNAGEKK